MGDSMFLQHCKRANPTPVHDESTLENMRSVKTNTLKTLENMGILED